jgi:histidine triad (HIT) family protein
LFLAILDRFPKCAGHILIISKEHAETLFELSDAAASGLLPLAKRLAVAQREALGFEGLNLLQNNGTVAGQIIPHFHLHLIPRYEDDGMKFKYEALDPPASEFEETLRKIKERLICPSAS